MKYMYIHDSSNKQSIYNNKYIFVARKRKAYHVTFSIIQGTNFEIRVQTPGKLASAQPIPHDIMPAKK